MHSIRKIVLLITIFLASIVFSAPAQNLPSPGITNKVNINMLAKKRKKRRKKRKRKKRRKRRRRKKRRKPVIRVKESKTDIEKRQLAQVLNAYLKDDFEEAINLAIPLLGKPSLKRAANYYIALSLANLDFYRSSLFFFSEVIKMGSGSSRGARRYYRQSLNTLMKIAHDIPDDSIIPHVLSGVDIKNIGGIKKKKYFYYLGKYYFYTDQYREALRSLSRVDSGSPYFAKARYIMGVVYSLRKDFGKALNIFRKIASMPDESNGVQNYLMKDKANLALARLFYGFGKYKLSQVFYEKILDDSPLWMKAVFESSWAYFVNKDYNKVFGKLEIINSPFFDDKFVPEFSLLRGIVLLRMCRVIELKPAIVKFNKAYTPMVKPIVKYVKNYKSNIKRHFKAIENFYLGDDDYRGLPRRLASHIALEDAVFNVYNKIYSVLDEKEDLDDFGSSTASAIFYKKVSKKLKTYSNKLKNKAGRLVGSRIRYYYRNLGDQIDRSRLVRLQYMGEEKALMEKNMVVYASKNLKADEIKAKYVDITDDYTYWPFENEYWRDELGYYEFRMENACDK